ncbi:unnamed protein product [Schistocephalus solidus]|uniref:Serine/arginine repetitive matrix protein 1 n=1 Tax=Schistocephalus solidus TaxID=70667 RepID=A0A183T5I3_SCHSO|nr:unnamed protein product [Schistocephalus solidus]
MGHGFFLVGERPELVWAAYGVAVAPTVGLFERGEVGSSESDIPGVEVHTTPETLTWFSPPVVTVARGVAAGKNPTSRSHSLTPDDHQSIGDALALLSCLRTLGKNELLGVHAIHQVIQPIRNIDRDLEVLPGSEEFLVEICRIRLASTPLAALSRFHQDGLAGRSVSVFLMILFSDRSPIRAASPVIRSREIAPRRYAREVTTDDSPPVRRYSRPPRPEPSPRRYPRDLPPREVPNTGKYGAQSPPRPRVDARPLSSERRVREMPLDRSKWQPPRGSTDL